MSAIYLLDGKPHRLCDCDPMSNVCPRTKSGTRTLQTCGFSQCLIPAPDVMLAVSEKRRVLLDTDPYCPACGHNRDKSAVSTIDNEDGTKTCQMCQADWKEIERG